jgi:hypothetical protein
MKLDTDFRWQPSYLVGEPYPLAFDNVQNIVNFIQIKKLECLSQINSLIL